MRGSTQPISSAWSSRMAAVAVEALWKVEKQNGREGKRAFVAAPKIGGDVRGVLQQRWSVTQERIHKIHTNHNKHNETNRQAHKSSNHQTHSHTSYTPKQNAHESGWHPGLARTSLETGVTHPPTGRHTHTKNAHRAQSRETQSRPIRPWLGHEVFHEARQARRSRRDPSHARLG